MFQARVDFATGWQGAHLWRLIYGRALGPEPATQTLPSRGRSRTFVLVQVINFHQADPRGAVLALNDSGVIAGRQSRVDRAFTRVCRSKVGSL